MKVGDRVDQIPRMNVTEDDQSLHVDHFWNEVFTKNDNCGNV